MVKKKLYLITYKKIYKTNSFNLYFNTSIIFVYKCLKIKLNK